MARAAVPGRYASGDDEAVMVFVRLLVRGLMAFQAVHALLGVAAHFIFVHDRVLLPEVAFGAFAGGPDESLAGLLRLNLRPGAIEEERSDDDAKAQDNGDEHGAE